jgi:hypothetical protein
LACIPSCLQLLASSKPALSKTFKILFIGNRSVEYFLFNLIMHLITLLEFVCGVVALSRPSPTSSESCEFPCGFNGQVCCTRDQLCAINHDNQAICMSPPGQPQPPFRPTSTSSCNTATCGVWQAVTKTEIQTIYMTYSSFIPTGPCQSEPTSSCDSSKNQTQCGPICCASDQYCAMPGQCREAQSSSTQPFEKPIPTNEGEQRRLGAQLW